MLVRAAAGVLVSKALYALSMSMGSVTVRGAFVAHERRYAWKACCVDPCWWAGNGACWAPNGGKMFICVGVMYTMVTVAPLRRRMSTLPAGCRWMSRYVATQGPG